MARDDAIGLQFTQLKGQHSLRGVWDGSAQLHEPLLAGEEMKQDQWLPETADHGQRYSNGTSAFGIKPSGAHRIPR